MKSGLMRASLIGVGAIACFAAAKATAQQGLGDTQAGTPLAVADAAASVWTLEQQGRSLCTVRLSAKPIGPKVYGVEIAPDCGVNLPAGATGWRPSSDGAALLNGGGQTLIDFDRWSNSLLVAHRSSGADLQLRRGR